MASHNWLENIVSIRQAFKRFNEFVAKGGNPRRLSINHTASNDGDNTREALKPLKMEGLARARRDSLSYSFTNQKGVNHFWPTP